MTPRSLQAVLRTLADAGTPASDAELLRRFLADDEAAFAELVKRHGRLVWAVCRNLTGSDCEADDAFQATFLVLLKNARKVRAAGKLSSWLHGVAFKVCAKARQGARRRTTREQATAHREGNGTAVPDSAWDRALAAVHEEVAKLPDTLRVPFVMCCLEGKGVTEAAEQLGWKLGTLSGRLTRAKDAVLAKLDARGLTLGVVAAVGLVVPPTAVVAKASALASVGVAIPGSILQLTQGVIGMSMTSVKVLAATVLLACGLGVSVGTGWVGTADAQQPAKLKAKPDDDVKRLAAELERARALLAAQEAKLADEAELKARALADVLRAKELAAATAQQRALEELVRAKEAAGKLYQREVEEYKRVAGGKSDDRSLKTAKWEFEVVAMPKLIGANNLAPMLQERENAGWEFLGSFAAPDKLLFRRPVKSTSSIYTLPDGGTVLGGGARYTQVKPGTAIDFVNPAAVAGTAGSKPVVVAEAIRETKLTDAAALEAEIAALTAKLAAIKKAAATASHSVTFDKTSSPLNPETLISVLGELSDRKFGKGTKIHIGLKDGVVTVSGDKAVLEWATTFVKSLGGK